MGSVLCCSHVKKNLLCHFQNGEQWLLARLVSHLNSGQHVPRLMYGTLAVYRLGNVDGAVV